METFGAGVNFVVAPPMAVNSSVMAVLLVVNVIIADAFFTAVILEVLWFMVVFRFVCCNNVWVVNHFVACSLGT